MRWKTDAHGRLMKWRGYMAAYGRARPGQKAFRVWVRWPWRSKWFSEVSFSPYLKADVVPLDDFTGGSVTVEVADFDPDHGLRYDDAGWRRVYSTWVYETWPAGRRRRLRFRIPATLLPGEGTYQCRIEFDEREEVGDGEFAPLTDSFFYVPVPFRLHGSSTAVPLIAAGVAAGAAALSLLGAVVSALVGGG
jgi:hypothetical protein